MQITTLNKIIALFLTGTFLLVIILFGLHERIQNSGLLQQGGLATVAGSPALLLVTTFGLLSTILLLGLIVDSLAELTTDRLLRRSKEWPLMMRALMLKSDAEGYFYYRSMFEDQFGKIEKYKNLEAGRRATLSSAVALFFETASKDHVEWAIQHVSTYQLASNYLFMVLISPLVFWLLTGWPKIVWQHLPLSGSIYLVVAYALAHVTLSRFLYSYEVILRHVTLRLSEEIGKEAG